MIKFIKVNQLVFLVLSLFFLKDLFSDAAGYAGNKAIIVKSNEVTIIHRHDWSGATRKARQKMLWGDHNPFTKQNNYAYIECVNNESHDVIFKTPTPALTHIFITDDSRYILGLSNIKLTNPYQLILLDRSGKMLYFESISPDEAKLGEREYLEFKKRFPKVFKKLIKSKLIFKMKDSYYLNYLVIPLGDKVRSYLFKYLGPSHLSNNFTESETNYIDWYKAPNPEIQLSYNELGMVSVISLLDPAGIRIEIPIKVNRYYE